MFCFYPLQGAFAHVQAAEAVSVPVKSHLPSREEQILALQTTDEFDVLVIGGGATGCGCALDAVTRGEPGGLRCTAPGSHRL